MRDKKLTADFFKPVEACVVLNLSRTKLYNALARGEIPSTRIAGMIRIPRAWVEAKKQEALGE